MLIRWRTILVALIVATVYVAPGPTASLAGTRQAARSVPAGGLVFGIYPGGDAGELESPAPVDPELALQRIKALQGDRPFTVHLYTAWRDDDPSRLDAEIRRYTQAGLLVALTLRYLPPEGREGDAEGFAAYVRGVVGRYGVNADVIRYVVGNEGNVDENPGASDGRFAGVREAIVRGTIAARAELDRLGSPAEVGINLGITRWKSEAAFLRDLVRLGGPELRQAVAFVGIDVDPGRWPAGTTDAYRDMAGHLASSRNALRLAGFGPYVKLDVLENGYPTADEAEQVDRLTGMLRAVLRHHATFGVDGYAWSALWDADSASSSPFGHAGLLRSDLTPKPAYEQYRRLIRG